MSDENPEEKGYATQPMSGPLRSASVDLVGTKVTERYEVVERLGGGGFGDVFKALDLKIMSRPVVIKVLKDQVLKREGAARDWIMIKFQQEIEALSKIHDPGIVGIFDADKLADGRPFLVMEFVEGSNLREFVKKAREEQGTEQGLRLQDVGEIVRQVGRALSAAHDRNIIHRDLKPENIMVRQTRAGDLQVKVIDFGVAKVRDSLVASSSATSGFMVGSWRYMAPEQLQRKKVEAACDVYALGVIAYEVLTGHHPFPAREPALLKDLQVAGVKVKPRDLNPDLPEAAQHIVLRVLSYYPSERHKRARDFGDELGRALMFEEELAPVISPAPTPAQGSTLRDADGATPAEGAGPNVVQRQVAPVSKSWLDLRRRWLLVSIAIIAVAAAISFGVWQLYKARNSGSGQLAPTAANPERTLTCWISILRPQDKQPWKSMGGIAYGAGTKLWFNVQTTQDGALYLLAEGREGQQLSEINTLYPTHVSGKGDPVLPAGTVKVVNERPLEFRNSGAVIDLWIIWADKRIEKLDEIVKSSYQSELKVLDPAQQAAWRDFKNQHSSHKTEVVEDAANRQLVLKGQGNVLIALRRLEYQP